MRYGYSSIFGDMGREERPRRFSPSVRQDVVFGRLVDGVPMMPRDRAERDVRMPGRRKRKDQEEEDGDRVGR